MIGDEEGLRTIFGFALAREVFIKKTKSYNNQNQLQ